MTDKPPAARPAGRVAPLRGPVRPQPDESAMPGYRPEPIDFGAEIASGDLIESRLEVLADAHLEYVLLEDFKPAGCEPVERVSGQQYQPYGPGGLYGHMELRDTRVTFFADHIAPGEHTVSHVLRCEQPGTFRILPAAGEAMYSPYVQANSDSGNLTIVERPAEPPAGPSPPP